MRLGRNSFLRLTNLKSLSLTEKLNEKTRCRSHRHTPRDVATKFFNYSQSKRRRASGLS
jgi:hypothetical protein